MLEQPLSIKLADGTLVEVTDGWALVDMQAWAASPPNAAQHTWTLFVHKHLDGHFLVSVADDANKPHAEGIIVPLASEIPSAVLRLSVPSDPLGEWIDSIEQKMGEW